jgi:hypothetical protein
MGDPAGRPLSLRLGDRVTPPGLAMTTTCHCEARSAEAIPAQRNH